MRADQHATGICRQGFRVKAGVGEYVVALRKLMNGRGAESVRLCHRAGGIVRSRQVAADQVRLTGLVPRLFQSHGNSAFYFGGGITGQGMAEIFHHVQPVSATDDTQPDDVVSRVKQVFAMGRGEHQMSLRLGSVEVQRNVFRFLFKLRARCGRQTPREGGLIDKLMRKLLRRKHRFRVRASSTAQSGIKDERRRAGLRSRLICQIQKLPFRFEIVVEDGDVGRTCGRRNQR